MCSELSSAHHPGDVGNGLITTRWPVTHSKHLYLYLYTNYTGKWYKMVCSVSCKYLKLEVQSMKIHALEGGGPSAQPAPSHSPGALRGGRWPGDQGKMTPHHTSAAATAGSASLSWPWLPEPLAVLGDWAAAIQDLPVPWAGPGHLGGLRRLGILGTGWGCWASPSCGCGCHHLWGWDS